MVWAEPLYSRSRVNKAGAEYIDPAASATDREIALSVINNWRSAHSFPLNTIQVGLRDLSRKHDVDPTIAQRIKRLPSIRSKLVRFSGMDLARMQDIGGCRAVLSDLAAVNAVVASYDKSRHKHSLVRKDRYIDSPQSTGYRGVHLVYGFHSDRKAAWNGLKIEVQVRSRLQHAWATAVETVGTFTQQALKSSQGEADWLRFFALMGSTHALREGTALVPGTPTDSAELAKELRRHVKKLKVYERLEAYGEALRTVEGEIAQYKGHVFLLHLNIPESTLDIRTYRDALVAAQEYNAIERSIEGEEGQDVVLVKVESLASLRRAYPNYFLDTTAFVLSVKEAVE